MKLTWITSRLFAFSMTCVLSCSATALELNLDSGYHDNPFKQADDHSGSNFVSMNLSHRGRTDGKSHLQYSLDVYGESHEQSDADVFDARARVRWVQAGKLFGHSTSVLITGDIQSRRNTFVDQLTGREAKTSRGDVIGERFSYDAAKLGVEGIFRFTRQSSLGLYVYSSQRDYINDYGAIGLESLNFSEAGVQPSLRFKFDGGHYLRLMAYQKYRTYEGLLDDDERGMNVADSHVDYTLTGLGVLAVRQMTPASTLKVYLQGYQAKDSYVGARDMHYWKAETTYEYRFVNNSTLQAKLSTFSRAYQNDVISRLDAELSTPGKEQAGASLSLNYEQPLINISENLKWTCNIEATNIKNSDKRRSYSSTTFRIGLAYRW